MIHIIDLNFLNVSKSIASFLVETNNGPILIETGPDSTFKNLKKGIEKYNYNIENIKHVFLTHIHLDHAGAAWRLAEHGAKIYVHPKGAEHLIHPEKLMSSAKKIYQDKMDFLWGKFNPIAPELIKSCKNMENIILGGVEIEAIHTPGHANHHIAWKVNDTIFAGDVCGAKIDNGPVVPACPPPDIDIEAWVNSIKMILKKNANSLYLTHYGKVTNVSSHLKDLEKILKNWAYWIKEKMASGCSEKEMTSLFINYVNNNLKIKGVSKKLLEKYNAANPPYMSVSGLVRYWNKKNVL